jgi:hypothetical protein
MRKWNSITLLSAHGVSFLMIIGDLNVKSIAFLPSKANAILIVDSDAILARAIALQRLKPVRRRRREVSKFFRAVDLNQFPEHDGSDGLKSPHSTLLENPFCILIVKRTDQTNIVLRIASNVRRGSGPLPYHLATAPVPGHL